MNSPNFAGAPIQFDDPAQNLHAFVKLVGSLDPGVERIAWFGGQVFAVLGPNDALRPILGIEGFGVLRVAIQPDGSYRLFNRELAYYKDPRTDEVIDTWTNPFSGRACEVSHIHNKIVNVELSPRMKMDIDGNKFEIPFRPPWHILGDTACSTFEVHTALPNAMDPAIWPRESAGPILRLSEIFQRVTSLSHLTDSGRSHAEYTGTWTRFGPWLPWMLQGQSQGHLFYRAFMKSLPSVDELPPRLRALTDRRFPEYFSSPKDDTWGQANHSSFSVYMSERQPAK